MFVFREFIGAFFSSCQIICSFEFCVILVHSPVAKLFTHDLHHAMNISHTRTQTHTPKQDKYRVP